LFEQEAFHHFAAVSRQVIPYQDYSLSLHEPLQILEEGHQTLGVVTVRLGPGQ
jgi:hypothetical protein